MSFRVSTTHWEIIIDFMEKHPDLAKGYINRPSGKDVSKKLWEELTIQLNSTGLGERPTKKWQKTWTDFKHVLKKKAADIKSDTNGTGGGPSKAGSLSEIEKRVLSILGPSFYEGIGRLENGCSFVNDHPLNVTNKDETDKTCKSDIESVEEEAGTQSVSENEVSVVNKESVHQKSPLDHDYIKQPMKKGPKRVRSHSPRRIENMYRDTVTELRDIKTCLKELTNCAKGIHFALNKISDGLV